MERSIKLIPGSLILLKKDVLMFVDNLKPYMIQKKEILLYLGISYDKRFDRDFHVWLYKTKKIYCEIVYYNKYYKNNFKIM